MLITLASVVEEFLSPPAVFMLLLLLENIIRESPPERAAIDSAPPAGLSDSAAATLAVAASFLSMLLSAFTKAMSGVSGATTHPALKGTMAEEAGDGGSSCCDDSIKRGRSRLF